jgi:hypothetical protein
MQKVAEELRQKEKELALQREQRFFETTTK